MRKRNIVGSMGLTLALLVGMAPALHAGDTSAYRGFHLGMTVLAVAAEAGVPPETAKAVFDRPMLIQELRWQPSATRSGDGAQPEAVAQVLFGFCDGQLYRIVVSYDRDRTEGLTEQDVVEALSATYGPASRPASKVTVSSLSQDYADNELVTARWEDARASVNLFNGAHGSGFGLVIFSKDMAPRARAAIARGLLLSEQDRPRREAAEQKQRDEAERVVHAKARLVNKAAFRL